MNIILQRINIGLLALVSPMAWAAETVDAANPAPGIGAGQVFTVLAGLAFVLALVVGCGWFVKRFNGMPSARSGAIKVIAHGEVVVVNEKFGIRLTDVVSPSERIQKLK